MKYVTDNMRPEDWEQVRSIYLEGIGTGNSTGDLAGAWRDVILVERRSTVTGID